MKTRKYIYSILVIMLVLASCSTKKNTGMTRFWHSFTARYNVYYNGAQAYIEGSLEKEKGNKDNYTEMLPLYTVGNKASRELGKGNFDAAILKAQKAIQIHSIKAKPEWNKDRRKTQADIEWLSRKEYNPFLWRAWMLMGRSQFHQGEFDEAAATFSYMSRLYKGQPSIYGKARAWLAKCYIESGWLYDAEDVIRNMMRDSIDWRAQKEWDYTLCDYYLHVNDLPKAAEYLRKVIKHEMRRKQRAREYYLLGQIEAAQGHKLEAYNAFRKVVRQNPPYQLEFNARISMTEVMAEGQSKKMIGKLKRMARNENNKDYLDQVYYAIGNIYLAEKDTANAISAYEKGNEKATRSGIEKGVLLLHLGDLYWQMEKYGDAKRCYGEAIGLLDKERPDYEELAHRSKVLDELVPFTDAIHLQDSLLELSVMPEKDRLAAIDRVIDALKKKEKEEAAKGTEEEVAKRQQKYGNISMAENKIPQVPALGSTAGAAGAWYFYNTQAVVQGKQAFQRQWGRRDNIDDWQRNNKTVVGSQASDDEAELANLTDEQRDSIAAEKERMQEEELLSDSVEQDPHKREYYLAQIPFTEEQKAACHEIIKEGLVKSAIIFKDKLDNLRLSEKQFDRLRSQYPEYEPKDEVYYHLFLLHSRKGDHDVAKTFVDSLKQYCEDSKYTVLLTDPYFAENAKFGKHIEDSLYGATYEAFKADRFQEVYSNAEISKQRFPLGDNRDRFIFFYGMTKLNDGDVDECVSAMENVVKDYPQSAVSEMAGMIINGVRAGKKLYGAKFDLSNVWDRRNVALTEGSDSANVQTFSDEKNTDYLFVMAYAPDSVQENQLLFQMARYNFTSFIVRNFDIDIDDSYGMHHMIVSGFRNFDEARQYSRLLLQQDGIKRVMGKARPIVISEENLALIGNRYSYNDYDTFYVHHFAPLPVSRPEQLYDPVVVKSEEEGTRENPDPVKPFLPTDEVAPGGAKPISQNEGEEETRNDNIETIAIPEDKETVAPVGTEIDMPSSEESSKAEQTGEAFDIPADNAPSQSGGETIDMPAESPRQSSVDNDGMFDVPADSEPAKQTKSDDGMFDVPTDNEPAKQTKSDEGFAIPVETESKVPAIKRDDSNEFAIPDAQETTVSPATTESMDIPEYPAEQETVKEPVSQSGSNEGFVIPAEPENVAPANKSGVSDGFAIPDDAEPAKESSSQSDANDFAIPDDGADDKKKDDGAVEIVIGDGDSDSGKDNADNGGETFEFSDGESTKTESNDDSETFEFSDDEGKKSSRDIEDEYYELDGF